MFGSIHRLVLIAIAMVGVGIWALTARAAVSFTTQYTDGGTWRTIYAQGFKASVTPTPNPGHAATDTVHLDKFQFFKSGVADTAANFQLAIVNNYFVNLATFTTSSPELVGLSTNTIASTSALNTGDPITFNFNHLALTYGADNQDELANNNYAAIFVNNNGGNLTPVLVSTLGVNYITGQNEIQSDYGTQPFDYFLSCSNYINVIDTANSYLATFNYTDTNRNGDANFIASFDLPAGTPGDYNGNGIVDAADYVVWRKNLEVAVTLPNDSTPGAVTQADYDVWKANFGLGSGAGASLTGVAVPEPGSLVLAGLAGLSPLGFRRWAARR